MIKELLIKDIVKELNTIKYPRVHDVHQIECLDNRHFVEVKVIKRFFKLLKTQGIVTVTIDFIGKKAILVVFNEGKSNYTIKNVYYSEKRTL